MSHQTSGVNAGYLYRLSENSSIYFLDPEGSHSPFDNPQFVDTFQKAEKVAFQFIPTNREENAIEHFKSLSEMLIPKIEEHMAEETILACNHRLRELILEDAALKEHLSEPKERASDEFCSLFALYFVLSSHIKRNVGTSESKSNAKLIEEKAREGEKEEEVFLDHREHQEEEKVCLELLLDLPEFYLLLEEICLSDKMRDDFLVADTINGKLWDLGSIFGSANFFQKYEEILERKFLERIGIDPEFLEKQKQELDRLEKEGDLDKFYARLKELKSKRDEYVQQMKAIKSRRLSFIEALNRVRKPSMIALAEKVAAQVAMNAKVLVVASNIDREELLQELASRNITIQGPIRQEMKPIGFLWEIEKAQRVVGYCLGSIHVASKAMLEFNSKIEDAFLRSTVLGLEEDVLQIDDANPNHITLIKAQLTKFNLELDESDPDFIQKAVNMLIIEYSKRGLPAGLGVDYQFALRAKGKGMDIVALETKETHQTRSRDPSYETIPLDVWEEFFSSSEGKEMVAEYMTGIPELREWRRSSDSEEEEALFNRSNMEMAISIDKLIRQGKLPFAVAGANHFPGQCGILQLLQHMGYKVRQVFCEEPSSV